MPLFLPVDAYIRSCTPWQQEILHTLREGILESSPAIREMLKYKIPFYTCYGMLCYLDAKKDRVVFGFCRGALLCNDEKLLTGNQKTVRHYVVKKGGFPDMKKLAPLFQEAILLNEWQKKK